MPQIKFAVHVLVDRRTNQDRVALADMARRQADYLGGPGMRAKRGQTDEGFRKNNRLRLVFESRKIAKKFQNRVEQNFPDAVTAKFFRV